MALARSRASVSRAFDTGLRVLSSATNRIGAQLPTTLSSIAPVVQSKLSDLTAFVRPSTPEEKQAQSEKENDEIFTKSAEYLLERPVWTFGAYRHYQERMLELLGGTGFKGWISKDQPNPLLDKTKQTIRVLSRMNSFELASNHKSAFTAQALRDIAEAAGVEEAAVREVLLEHDMLRADRRWYQIRTQFGRPLPRCSEEKNNLALFDRPISQSEKEKLKIRAHKMKSWTFDVLKRPVPRLTGLYVRKKSKGINRWSDRGPVPEAPRMWK